MNNSKKTAMYFMYIMDVISLIISFCIAYFVKFNWIEKENNIIRSDYMILFLLIFIIYILINSTIIKNIEFINRDITREIIETVKMIIYISVLAMVCLFFLKNSANYSRSMMFIFMCVSCPSMFIGRMLLKWGLNIAYSSDRYKEKVVIISDSLHIEETMSGIKDDDNFKIIGIVLSDCSEIGDEYYGVEVIADKDSYIQSIEKREVDSVFLSVNSLDTEISAEMISALQSIGKNVHVRLTEYELCDGYKQFKKMGSYATVSYMSSKNMMFYQVVIRRIVEVVIGLAGCLLTIILMPFIGLGMLIESPGKMIISNIRIGRNGRRYLQYKFRTMKMNAQKCVNNHENPYMVTGRILYKLNLDKLPQFYNLLCGDIGLVGPQSPSVVQYMNYAPAQKRKLTIKPGVIGEWSFRPKAYEQIAATSESYDMPYDKNIKGDIKRIVMAIGRCVVYHPKHIIKQWEIEEQIGIINEIIENKAAYQYDQSAYTITNTMGRKIYLIIKRMFDIILSVIGLIVLSPIFLVVIICIISEDGGNPFYGHVRIGKNGKKIRIYKFRSMKNIDVDIEKILTPEQLLQYRTEFKIDNDPRITKVGNFLRKSSLDELPQLINILKGDISIVGPRPIVEKEIKIYGKDTAKLLSVQPGLTGYWQAYARNNATYESGERQRMEMYYVEHQSLWLDIKIIFKTFGSVLKGSGAQ